MSPTVYRRLYLVLNTLLLSTACIVAQDNNFYKQMLKESMKESVKDMMKPNAAKNDLPDNDPEKKIVNLEIDPKKIKIPLHASFNYELDSLIKAVEAYMEKELKKKELVVSPGFFEAYKELPIDAYYNKTPVFIDGKWFPASALGGGISPMVIIGLLFSSGIIKDNPLPPTKSKKEKALERLRTVYGSETGNKKWSGDSRGLNDAINRLREEVERAKNEKNEENEGN